MKCKRCEKFVLFRTESWYEDHQNPPGTIDCGDGYYDEDTGVFIEY